MNIKRIKARININYIDVIKNIINNESMNDAKLLSYLCKELTILQKYILELLLDRINRQIKIKELING